MARLSTIQHFSSISELKQNYRITLPKPYEWRLLVAPYTGEINGLPATRGIAVATNGIEVAIMQPTGLVIGHLDFFVADEQESTPSVTKRSSPIATKSRTPRQKVDVSEFI